MADSKANEGSLELHLGYWMRLVSNQVSGAFARALGQHDMSVAEWVALNEIDRTVEMTSSALSTSMGVTRGAVSKILNKLESKSLLERITSVGDSRVQHLSLTLQAKQLLPTLMAVANSNDDHFFSVLDETEQAGLRAILRKLAELHDIRTLPVE